MKNDQEILNYVFDTYRSCRSFLKETHLNLDYCCLHQDPEVWKQDQYGMDSNISEDNLGGEAEYFWSKLLERPARGMSQKMVNLIWSEQRNVVFITYKLSSD